MLGALGLAGMSQTCRVHSNFTMLAAPQVNICLTELNLSWNKLRPRGAVAVAEGLKPNLTVQV